MSDLQDALNYNDKFRLTGSQGDAKDEVMLDIILETARKYANPDYAAMFTAWWKNDHILNEQERLTLAFDAALGVTEDADG